MFNPPSGPLTLSPLWWVAYVTARFPDAPPPRADAAPGDPHGTLDDDMPPYDPSKDQLMKRVLQMLGEA